MEYQIRTIGINVGDWEDFKFIELRTWLTDWVDKGLGSIEIKKMM